MSALRTRCIRGVWRLCRDIAAAELFPANTSVEDGDAAAAAAEGGDRAWGTDAEAALILNSFSKRVRSCVLSEDSTPELWNFLYNWPWKECKDNSPSSPVLALPGASAEAESDADSDGLVL